MSVAGLVDKVLKNDNAHFKSWVLKVWYCGPSHRRGVEEVVTSSPNLSYLLRFAQFLDASRFVIIWSLILNNWAKIAWYYCLTHLRPQLHLKSLKLFGAQHEEHLVCQIADYSYVCHITVVSDLCCMSYLSLVSVCLLMVPYPTKAKCMSNFIYTFIG